ncbi:hypothetical protein LV780_18845 [Cereibacter azotoformans]|nr:hypothetical protein [Cereibacter azotoformans]AXQ95408.1 hypothetical protein D0Z66_16395 [Cereibacter sphaeroides]UIJ32360.1 hypothetical protein LV780_18845 [Cereibacter azotoformans]
MPKFSVRGSRGNIYQITVTGAGSDLRIHCKCPAGRIAGKFCKHVSALLNGDITNVIEGADDVHLLKEMQQGSPLSARARRYEEAAGEDLRIAEFSHVISIDLFLENFSAQVEEAGWKIERRLQPERLPYVLPQERLEFFGKKRGGVWRATPSHILHYEPFTAEVNHDDQMAFFGGQETIEVRLEDVKPKKTPWR